MRTLYGTDSKHRLWIKTEYADGRIEIQMQKNFGDKPVKVTPHSYKKGVVCFESGNSFYHEPLEYINWGPKTPLEEMLEEPRHRPTVVRTNRPSRGYGRWSAERLQHPPFIQADTGGNQNESTE
jgi:hypothetical protein